MKYIAAGTVRLSPQNETAGISYRTVWRWHFYAGLFCIPFVIWLSITGSIFLFKPQIERWLDRPYDSLSIDGQRATAESQVKSALLAVPGSNLHSYELPRSTHSAIRIIVGLEAKEYRVYVHPQTLQILNIVDEDKRPMKVIQRLHGELMLGDKGSMLVELAASWAIVMILTGLYLWWPKEAANLAGVLFIRLHKGSRTFWRDLHSVTGVWVSAFALFLLLTGLPWAKSWGGYLKKARSLASTEIVQQDWSTGQSSDVAKRTSMNHVGVEGVLMEHAGHAGHGTSMSSASVSYKQIDKMITTVTPLLLEYPVLISPPMHDGGPWTAKSDTQNRPLRTSLTLDAKTGALVRRDNFNQHNIVDRIVGVGVAAHEGQLFGLANQLIGLFTAMALVLLSLSATVLWWRRRHIGILGAPIPAGRTTWSFPLIAAIVALALYLPAMGGSLIIVILLEKLLLSRISAASRWLGLRSA